MKWHGVRGDDLLSYTELGHLPQIMQQNWEHFEAYGPRVDWATALFSTLERSRNVIMHSGSLALPDVERIGMHIRDWNKQVSLLGHRSKCVRTPGLQARLKSTQSLRCRAGGCGLAPTEVS